MVWLCIAFKKGRISYRSYKYYRARWQHHQTKLPGHGYRMPALIVLYMLYISSLYSICNLYG
jgi:hypothetical protein